MRPEILKRGTGMRKTITALLLLCLMAVCLTGCQKKDATAADKAELAKYLASVEGQSNALKASLENDPLPQVDMNMKSEELRQLWDAVLTTMLDKAKSALPAAEWKALTEAQNAWTAATEAAVAAAGKDWEGGSMYPLVVNMEAARLTEARAYEIYEMLK